MSKFIINSGFFEGKKKSEVFKLIDCVDGSIYYVTNLKAGYKYFKCVINNEEKCVHLENKIYGTETDKITSIIQTKSCKDCINSL